MTQELAQTMMCVVMRNGVELWIQPAKAKVLQELLGNITESKFVTLTGTFGEKTINTADITGIFSPQDIEDSKRRKNGEWKCDEGYWHGRREQCNHKKTVPVAKVEPEQPRTPEEQKRINKSLAEVRKNLTGKLKM